MTLAAGVLAGACASQRPVGDDSLRAPLLLVSEADRPFLLDPLAGFSQAVDAGRAERLTRSYRALVDEGQAAVARRAAHEMLDIDPRLPAASLLAAQVSFVEGQWGAARDLLRPVVHDFPTYVAARLLLGRTYEVLGDLGAAVAELQAIVGQNAIAAQRAGELLPAAEAALGEAVTTALAQGEVEAAQEHLALLAQIAPSSRATYLATAELAREQGVAERELAALRQLAALDAGEPVARQRRRAHLELEVGDAATALDLLQLLSKSAPSDAELRDELSAARFRWRLSLLPRSVSGVLSSDPLSRAQFAELLYWLVPEVRYRKPAGGRIATDILDIPQQAAVARVVNLGLMDVDTNLHRFAPGASLNRLDALTALVRLGRLRAASCFAAGGVASAETCELAMACGLVPTEVECRSREPISGRAAAELIRRSLEP